MRMFLLTIAMIALAAAPVHAAPQQTPDWVDQLGAIAIQDGGRVMPLDTYARTIAVRLTGRTHWSAQRGPAAFAGRHPIQLLCDLMFRPDQMIDQPLIAIENRPFKKRVGLDDTQRFFSAKELGESEAVQRLIVAARQARQSGMRQKPTDDQRRAEDIDQALMTFLGFQHDQDLRIVPNPAGDTFLWVSRSAAEPGAEPVQLALAELAAQYVSGADPRPQVRNLAKAIAAVAPLDAKAARQVELELLYNHHQPWRKTAFALGLAIIFLGLAPIFWRKLLWTAGLACVLWAVAEQVLGLALRTMILDRVPVANTYESLLWMGLVAILIGAIAQVINRKSWYLLAGVIAAELSVLFAMLVPLESQTGAIPAVLRSNFWLIVHVLVIVASYGVLLLAAVLGHVYLIKNVLLAPKDEQPKALGNPLITQTYRAMQVGLLLLTAGTILGGVWAADSWGRFWGWDPKETWALISIVIYFILIHGRYVGWIKDFGLAVASIVGMMAIVWTFYGVNYVMAAGLHSYGFGSGGEFWVGLWVIAEIVFLILCKSRQGQRAIADTPPES